MKQKIKNRKDVGNKHAQLIKKIINRNKEVQQLTIVVHLSSMVIADNSLLNSFAENIDILSKIGIKFVIVHDFEYLIERYFDDFEFIRGKNRLSFWDVKTDDIAQMIISCQINSNIVSKLCSYNLQAVGLSGIDANLITSRNAKHQNKDAFSSIKDIASSDPLLINPEILFEIDDTKIIPIIAPVAHNENGRIVVLEASYTSAMLATSISANMLIMMCDDDFLVNHVRVLSSIVELENILDNSIEIDFDNSVVRASKYALKNSDISIRFIDSSKADSLLMSIFD